MSHSETEIVTRIPDLLVRPHPVRGEGPSGYLLRLAEANFMSLRELQDFGLIYELSVFEAQHLLPPVALYPELHDYIAKIAALRKDSPGIWNAKFARFCPCCINEEPVWKVAWEIHHYDACTKHDVWLVDTCTSCGERLHWRRDSLLRCPCGADLRHESYSAAPKEVTQLSRLLEQALLNEQRTLPEGFYPLEGLSVEQLHKLIRYVGAYLEPNGATKPLKIMDAGAMEVSWGITSLAASMLSNWPVNFHQILDQFQVSDANRKASLSSVFKTAYSYLYRGGLKPTVFNPVREAFETWITLNWQGGVAKRNRRLSLKLLEEVSWIPGKAAADQLGISMERLKYLIRSGQLEGQESISTTGRRFVMVRKDRLDSISEILAGEITLTQALDILGIGKMRMRRILSLLFPSARRVNEQEHFPWSISTTEVYQLAEFGNNLPMVVTPEEDEISLGDLLKYWQWSAEEIVSLIEAVKAGSLPIISILVARVGITRWVFKRKALQQWRLGLSSERLNWLTIPEMAKVLGIKQRIAYWLVQDGHIPSHQLGKYKGHGARIKKSDVDKFLRDHIFATEIADRVGQSPRKVGNQLRDLSIYPIGNDGVNTCKQLIYNRSIAIDRFVAEHSVGETTKLRTTVARRQKAWDRIIQENETTVPSPSHFRLESD